MCKIPKIVIVAPAERHAELRRALSSLEYEIAATVTSAAEGSGITADVAVAWEPDAEMIQALAAAGRKTVALGGDGTAADMSFPTDDTASFKARIWELFRPA